MDAKGKAIEGDFDGGGSDIRAAFSTQTIEILLAEYDHVSTSLMANEDSGEKRVNVFLGLIAAIIAGVAILSERLSERQFLMLAAVGGPVMLGYGFVTLRRLMERNLATTELINALRRIRASIIYRHPAMASAVSFVPLPKAIQRKRDPWWGLGKSGFLEIVALTNCLLLAGAIVPFLVGITLALKGFLILALVVLLWLLQMKWADAVYVAGERDRDNRRRAALVWWKNELAEVGGVKEERFRAGAGIIVISVKGQVLAFERSGDPGAWQLPQGGLRIDEEAVDAAWRELEEETSLTRGEVELVAEFDSWLGYQLPEAYRTAKTGRGQVHRWFLFRIRDHADEGEFVRAYEGEFAKSAWMDFDSLCAAAAPFRKPIYKILFQWVTTVSGREVPPIAPHTERAPSRF